MKSLAIAVAALAAAGGVLADSVRAVAARTIKPVEEPSAEPTLGAPVVQGCFSSKGSLVFNSRVTYNSKSACAIDICTAAGKLVAGTMGGNQCFCGDKYPPKSDLTNDTNCNVGCTGYGQQACGGINFWTIYNTGIDLAVDYSPDSAVSSSSSSTSTTAAPTSSIASTVSGSVIYVTQTAAPTESTAPEEKKKKKSNTGGIIAGVVVAVVVIAGIVGGVFFFLRRRRNHEIEEEHRRNAAVNAFIHGSKPPSSSGGFSMTDARLDPVMAQRRMSDGSIADNEDYSRRILRVTNA